MSTLKIEDISSFISKVTNKRFNYIATLGEGGMGSVYLVASCDNPKQEFAFKIVDKADSSYSEIDILKNLQHPGIPKTIEIIEDDHYFYILQEYVKGKPLRKIIEENGRVSEKLALLWMKNIAKTLAYIHSQGWIHRDIKPMNIMITPEGYTKVIDFGLAKRVNVYDTFDENVYGTRNYTAPERYTRSSADIQSDIYGFGSTCYFMVTGQVPIEVTETNQKLNQEMYRNLSVLRCQALSRIIAECMNPNPKGRTKDFNIVFSQLEAIEEYDLQIKKEEIAKKNTKKRRLIFLTIGLLTILLLLFFAQASRANLLFENHFQKPIINPMSQSVLSINQIFINGLF